MCLSVLEHLRDPSKFLSEILRVLKINGFIYLETPNWTYCKDIFYDDPTHQRPYTPKALENLLKIYEFKDIIITPNLRCKKSGGIMETSNILKRDTYYHLLMKKIYS